MIIRQIIKYKLYGKFEFWLICNVLPTVSEIEKVAETTLSLTNIKQYI